MPITNILNKVNVLDVVMMQMAISNASKVTSSRTVAKCKVQHRKSKQTLFIIYIYNMPLL